MAASHEDDNNQKKNDWSATQYLKFNTERTRPVFDLISRITPHLSQTRNPNIYDLGCGPGNSASILLSAFPSASLTGLDSSPDMLAKARATLQTAEFIQGDLSTFTPAPDADVVFSNAAFHWLRRGQRVPTLVRIFESLKPGAVLAVQMPDNYTEPSHALMRDVAVTPSKPWSSYLSSNSSVRVGDLTDTTRPDLDPVETPAEWYNAFTATSAAASVDIWRTTYQHVLQDARAIVEWVKGTGLQPFLQRMPEGEEGRAVREAFLNEYEERLKERYRPLGDGKVLLGYPRLFMVVVRK
ncbi:S-adenosyl-L-methionine-dependent methyltransferase [Periconia macrospinosa]|uniref:S-adenosyl-L-methionine-dependent methyltransferase n=1 Tax=Periconia macrospinosa TaxID=97972 RepID=A0A2V1DZM9_9PLEO|nr:S-adenosyl-L-methionine-dependent methyltransferase [Periconia macrospinosa]